MFALFAQALVVLVIGHSTPMTCAPIDDHAGWYHDGTVYVADWLCPYFDGSKRSTMFAFAAFTITHEAEHASGIEDEHAANCKALKDLGPVLTRVGLSKKQRHDVVAQAKSIQQHQPPPYSGAC